VQNPVCMPSRISMLSGQYPSQLKITHMGVPVPEDLPTFSHLFGRCGYTTANIGKLHFLPHVGRDHRILHPAYGFDHLEISDEPGCYEDTYRAWVRQKAPEYLDAISLGLPPATEMWHQLMGIRDGIRHAPVREPKAEAFPAPSDLTHSAFVAERTAEFIRSHRDAPFACIAGFYSPHSPWVAPQEYFDLYDPATLALPRFPADFEARRGEGFSDEVLRSARQGYYAMISEVDAHVGKLLDCLEEEGLAEDTIVVFTSDHGEYLGEFLRWAKGFPAEDPVSRVPLLVRWPRGLASGVTVEHIVEAVDVLPSLLQWTGQAVPPQMQGIPLPLSNDPAARTKCSAVLEHDGGKTLRTDRYRYIVWSNGTERLYDLEQEFGEYHDVATQSAYASALAEMRQELIQRMLRMERPLPRAFPY
jgi:arylsulfatase